tara:strand:- start:63 stop:896 length:834 start_codon:yes stop_codon:yes gene_type:complete
MSIFITAEIGINHNGDLEIAKKLIEGAKEAGVDAVKFQKRTIDLVYEQDMLDSPRESPWGTTQREQKEGLEFGKTEYEEIDTYCKKLKIEWFASAWDVESQIFLRQFNCRFNKVASAMLTHKPLIDAIVEEKKHTFISTGMHTIEEISEVVNLFIENDCPYELMHCCSTYPMDVHDANLKTIQTLKNKFNCNVGYSGHEVGLAVSLGAAAMDISSLERHITLDRSMYGSDQSASVELSGLKKLVEYVRTIELAMGDGEKKVTDKEKEIRSKLAPINL